MKNTPINELVVYLVVVLLSLSVLALVAVAPEGFMNTSAVYRGF